MSLEGVVIYGLWISFVEFFELVVNHKLFGLSLYRYHYHYNTSFIQ